VTEERPDSLETAEKQDYARLKAAYNIACSNIVEINENRAKLTECLGTALTLVENLLSEMRIANVVPSSQVVFSKANLDRAMLKLLGKMDASKE